VGVVEVGVEVLVLVHDEWCDWLAQSGEVDGDGDGATSLAFVAARRWRSHAEHAVGGEGGLVTRVDEVVRLGRWTMDHWRDKVGT